MPQAARRAPPRCMQDQAHGATANSVEVVRAVAFLAYEEAVRLFRMALRVLRDSPDEERQCEVLLLLGDAEARSGDTPASKETFLLAAQIAARLNLPASLA